MVIRSSMSLELPRQAGNVTRFSWRCGLLVVLCVVVPLGSKKVDGGEVVPCRQAHAHNDYLHPRPLLDALDKGFCSVEADIFLVDGTLLVAHSFVELSPTRTLKTLYLDPLRDRVNQNGGSVFGDGTPFTLLIDLKSDGESTFVALNKLLNEYADVFSHSEAGELHPGAVSAIVSGNRPIETITVASPRFAGIDGRLSDLASDTPPELMPLISDNWTNHFKWRGNGEISAEELAKLKSVITQIHAKGRIVRFWATPDNPAVWKVLRDAGVDMINTDDLAGLSQFLDARQVR
jgi:glycerophosphoryl diester phosphodiesterase